MIRFAFWLSLALTAYAYIGYPICLALFSRRKLIRKAPIMPTVSILIAARNEEATLPRKLENLSRLHYPGSLTQIIIVSDGSTDRTPFLLEEAPGVLAILRPAPSSDPAVARVPQGGKAIALNEAVHHATGDILVFLDIRQAVDLDAISALVAPFADPKVGAVSGELDLQAAQPATGPAPPRAGNSAPTTAANALGIYWKIEKAVRKLESASGSVVGVTGAIYAIRRELYTPIPPGTILDDVFVPMHVALAGKRVIFEPLAIARDRIFAASAKEFSRKVRTLTGNYQLLRLAPWLLSPRNPLLFRFVSHKLARLVVPLLLLITLLTSALARSPLYHAIFYLQLAFYALAVLGILAPTTTRLKPISIAATFVMLNAAATVAFYNFLRNHDEVWS
jgi:cellulose synthase/poly-beta-1,6-N-acetylglucosamine synthase-like glycosyltransferase